MKKAPVSNKTIVLLSILLGILYGLSVRFAFGSDKLGAAFEIMSTGFIFGVPTGLGFISVWFCEYNRKLSWHERFLLPWIAGTAYLIACLLLAWEGLICIILWLPLVLGLSSLGGLLAGALGIYLKRSKSRMSCVAIVAVIPFVAAPIESLKHAASEIRSVENSIVIDAPPSVVWEQIRSVPRIQASEHFFSFSHLLGFPLPVEATLEGTGVGSVRHARFEGDVLFIETVTHWEPHKKLAFSIDADTENIPPDTFDEHVNVGGPYFDVLQGEYEIEPINDYQVILHLRSDQRLSTRFNFYSHLWTEALMSDLQSYILKIIKHRCEQNQPISKRH